MTRKICAAAATLLLSGCATVTGDMQYQLPEATRPAANVKLIDKPREQVWSAAVPALGKQFFVINNLDKGSGLINISYSGDPEKYIDCGRISTRVKNMAGERSYSFPAAQAQQSYEAVGSNPTSGMTLLFIYQRSMTLEGRVNLVFEEVSPTQTRVSANTRYVVQRTVGYHHPAGATFGPLVHSIQFGTGAKATFPKSAGPLPATECVSTGLLESELLALLQ